MLQSLDNRELAYALKYSFTTSNNKSEYESPHSEITHDISFKRRPTHHPSYSKVVFSHVTGSFEAKENNMKKYSTIVKGLMKEFATTWFEKIDRKDN